MNTKQHISALASVIKIIMLLLGMKAQRKIRDVEYLAYKAKYGKK